MIPVLELVDWMLDGGALLLSIFIAKKVVGLSWKQVGIIVLCFSIYTLHEMWEAGIIFEGTHRAFELWITKRVLL